MTYNVRAGGYRISIDYETRHPDRIHVKNCIGIADFRISENNEKYDMILSQAENIVFELNKLKDTINSLETNLAMSYTSMTFGIFESENICNLKQKLREKDYEVNHLIDSIYRKTDEFYEEKKKLLLENNALRKENKQSTAMVEAVRKTELSKIPTDELAQELYSRMNKLDKLERNHEKLLVKHKTAANMIADLKK